MHWGEAPEENGDRVGSESEEPLKDFEFYSKGNRKPQTHVRVKNDVVQSTLLKSTFC